MLSMILFTACVDFTTTNRVEELRVMAVQTVPAEISPNDGPAEINIVITDPDAKGAEVMVWPCTDFGEGCLEAEFFTDDLTGWVQTFTKEQTVSTIPLNIPPELSFVLAELPEDAIPFTGTTLWVLACEPGVCDAFSQLRDGTLDKSWLSKPKKMIEGLALNEASLARRRLRLSNRQMDERIQNPTLTPTFSDPVTVQLGESRELIFAYDFNAEADGIDLHSYSSVGLIDLNPDEEAFPEDATTGNLFFVWQAAEQSESGEIFVILENAGGVDFWVGQGTVE